MVKIHGNLKPSNVLVRHHVGILVDDVHKLIVRHSPVMKIVGEIQLNKRMRPVLVDYGGRPASNGIAWTAPWLAPEMRAEQVDERIEFSNKVDIFPVGILM